MNQLLLRQLSDGPHTEFIEKFQSSRYEYIGIELHASVDRDDIVAHRMLASGHQGRVRFALHDIIGAVNKISAVGVTLIHNHPFTHKVGPSREDIRATERVHQALLEIGAQVLDHRIYCEGGRCFSFVDEKVGRWGWDILEFE